jgi:triosephosphate isomerase
MTRRLVFAANWKMHLGPGSASDFLGRFLTATPLLEHRTLLFFPPAASLLTVAAALQGRTDARAGAQNIHWEPKGAFTGEMSVGIAQEAGAAGALVGHSERRHVFGETDQQTGFKVRALLAAGMEVMLCVGETLAEREAGLTEEVCLRQVAAGLSDMAPAQLGQVTIAYEPVWAIGTGRNATPEDAATVHQSIREALAARGTSMRIPVLYGGSVNAGNATALLAQPEIDGVLVGGASLDPDGWAQICATEA